MIQGVPNDNDWPGGENPALAIDDNINTKFLHFKGETQPTGFQVTPAIGSTIVMELTFTTANDAEERDPVSYELYGSNTSIDGPYTLIASGEIGDFAQTTAWPRFTMNSTPIAFTNKTAYLHYQILFPKVRNAAGANSMQIAEVELLGYLPTEVPDDVDPNEANDPVDGSSVVISEFKAINETGQSTTVQGKTAYPDWIEIQNRGTTAVDLNGWYLTDDPDNLTKWAFPSVQVAPLGFLLVFASGIEESDHPENWPYRDSLGYYHTNFILDGKGEYLALISPDGQVAHEYVSNAKGTGYPTQRADLSYGLSGTEERYFVTATPGHANGVGYAGLSEEPVFSQEGGAYTGLYFYLELTASNPDAVIYYTLDGQIPTSSSTKYTAPILINGTKEVAARVYEPGKAPSEVVSRTYMSLADDLKNFTSNVPVVIIDTARKGIGGSQTQVRSVFVDTGDNGRTSWAAASNHTGRAGIKIRGSSTAGQAKPSYNIELWDQSNRDLDVSLLGMPAESDWVLYAPYSFDRALINNALVYELSNQIGRYAVRTRFVEMYLNTDDDLIEAGDYVGLYIFMEKIKRGEDRVDVEKLDPWDSTEPKISGGYMLKIDRPDPGDGGFRTSRGNPTYGDGTICYVNPKESEITTAQSAWIKSYLNNFETALYGNNFADPQNGYAKYIDVASWIDHNLLNMLPMNVDALRLSTHFHKSRDGKLAMGPLWDFDRALDSTDGRDDNAQSWHGTGDGTDYLGYVWWNRLFEDSNFWQQYIDRWFELRQGPFSTAGLNATIDGMANEIREAAARNYAKWPGTGPRSQYGGTFQGEIDHLKSWLQTRCTWIDNQFVAPPTISPAAGRVESGTTVALTNPRASGVLYYTLDGSDPRPADASTTVIDATTLVAENAAKRVLVPTGAIDNAWRSNPDFDDSKWTSGTGGVGFERGTGYESYFSIDVGAAMYGINSSCYIRIPFTISGDPRTASSLILKARYDDGFVAYINGVEVQRAVFDDVLAWNSTAYANHDDFEAIELEAFDISAQAGALKQGKNVLAIQAMNSSNTSSDFLFSVTLAAVMSDIPIDTGLSEAVQVYTGPITIGESTQIKARVKVASNSYSTWSGLTDAIFDVGPAPESVRISEVMYNPANSDDAEYVELVNTTDSAVTLYDSIRGLPWRFTDNPENPAIDLQFPTEPPVTLAPGERLLLVRDLQAFQTTYDVPAGVQILEWGDGKLSNSGETLELYCPSDVTVDGLQSWIVADSIVYSDGSHPEDFTTGVDPWPTDADGEGKALSRTNLAGDGTDSANWEAASPSPGVAE
ncbi:MAG: CotH kinase family protein [Solirubrobacterales bacterium]